MTENQWLYDTIKNLGSDMEEKELEGVVEITQEKWSWHIFLIKTFCWRNFIWGIATIFVGYMLISANGNLESVVHIILASVWGVLSIIMVLHKAFEKAVGNADIKAELRAEHKINTELSSVIQALKG